MKVRPGTAEAFQGQLKAAADGDDPVGWAQRELRAHLWSRQREILESLRDNRRTAVQAGHGVGKSFTAAVAAGWWVANHAVDQVKVVTTAPTADQVEKILWQRIRRVHDRGRLGGRITGGHVPAWKFGETIVAYGRKPADYTPDAFQGEHARFILVILDEAGGIPKWLYTAAESLGTNENARILAIGNPTDPGSEFAEICKAGSGWNRLKISVFDTPAFTGEEVPAELLEELVGPTWVEERKARWGEGSPIYTSRVLGEFPAVSTDTLIAPHLIERAQRREIGTTPDTLAAGQLGCDIARFGADRTVIYRNHGGRIRLDHEVQGNDTMRTADEIAFRLRQSSVTHALVDVIGVGAGVYDRLVQLGLDALPFNSSSRPRDPERFANRRAEAYWMFREALEHDEIDLDPNDDKLAAQIGSIKYLIAAGGKTLIESKDAMKARGLPSPDHADAAVMAFAGGPTARGWRDWRAELSEAERWLLDNPPRRELPGGDWDSGKPPGLTWTGDLLEDGAL